MIDGRFKDQPTNSNVMKYFEGIQTLLKVGGRYLCLTYAPADILDRLLDYFSLGWFFRVHWLHVYLEVSYERPALLPLFLFVLTKTTFAGKRTSLKKQRQFKLHWSKHTEIGLNSRTFFNYYTLNSIQHIGIKLYFPFALSCELQRPCVNFILLPSSNFFNRTQLTPEF